MVVNYLLIILIKNIFLLIKTINGTLISMNKIRLEYIQAVSGGYNKEDIYYKEVIDLDI